MTAASRTTESPAYAQAVQATADAFPPLSAAKRARVTLLLRPIAVSPLMPAVRAS